MFEHSREAVNERWAPPGTPNGAFHTRFWGKGRISAAASSTSRFSDDGGGTSVAVSNDEPEPNASADKSLAAATAVLAETAIEPQAPTAIETVFVTEPRFMTGSNRALVSATDLPPAADVMTTLFAEESPAIEETPAEDTNIPEISDSWSNDETKAIADATVPEIREDKEAELTPVGEPSTAEDLTSVLDQPSVDDSISTAESVSIADAAALGDSTLNEASPENSAQPATLDAVPDPTVEEAALEPAVTVPEENPEANPEPIPEEISQTDQEAKTDDDFGDYSFPSKSGVVAPVSDWAFEEKLASHREWLESQGATGKKANWANVSLEETELIGISLRFADLHAANLKGADLLLADLRDTCLVRANLQEACLVGANLEGANLEGASLATSMGLVARQLAGTNLRDAELPAEIGEFGALAEFDRACSSAYQFFVALMSVSALSALVIWRTKDAQLILDSGLISIPHFPAAAAALPTEEIYLIAPVLLFILYFTFQFHLQRVWTAMLELPAVFPDGRVLGQSAPRIIAGLLRSHFRWMDQEVASAAQVEKIFSLLLAYVAAPAVLLLFWARYLTLQDLHGTILQAVLVAAASGMTLYAMTRVGRPQEKWAVEGKRTRFTGKLRKINVASLTAGFCVFLLILSFGTIQGIPREKALAPQFMSFDVRRWAPSVLWLVGFDPYAKLPEATISTPPENWTGADDQVSSVKGAQLNGRSLRYAQVYGAFLANARLFRSNFQGAFLSEADLRGADLGQSSLRLADLDRAQMSHSNLNRADLDGANLARADLRNADLSYASLSKTSLVDAQLGGASFYEAHLPFASLVRANMEKADLRSADLEGADLEHADAQQAYLWSARLPDAHLREAHLEGAILIGANLRGADLGGAQLSGTVLNEADLTDTNLAGADLRGTLGLTASQICSAKFRQGALLDDAMQTQVNAQCGLH